MCDAKNILSTGHRYSYLLQMITVICSTKQYPITNQKILDLLSWGYLWQPPMLSSRISPPPAAYAIQPGGDQGHDVHAPGYERSPV